MELYPAPDPEDVGSHEAMSPVQTRHVMPKDPFERERVIRPLGFGPPQVVALTNALSTTVREEAGSLRVAPRDILLSEMAQLADD